MLLGMTILTDRRNHELDRVNCNLNTHSMNDCLSKKSLVCGRLNLHTPCSVRFFMVMLNVESTLNSLLGQLDENCCLENIPINMNAIKSKGLQYAMVYFNVYRTFSILDFIYCGSNPLIRFFPRKFI